MAVQFFFPTEFDFLSIPRPDFLPPNPLPIPKGKSFDTTALLKKLKNRDLFSSLLNTKNLSPVLGMWERVGIPLAQS